MQFVVANSDTTDMPPGGSDDSSTALCDARVCGRLVWRIVSVVFSKRPVFVRMGRSREPRFDPSLMAFLSRRAIGASFGGSQGRRRTGRQPSRQWCLWSKALFPTALERHLPKAREVIADTQARIADLQSRLMQFDAALRRIDAALGWMPEVSYFRGHLFETRGLVEQRLSSELAKRGDTAEAQAAKSRALVAFETAMQIQADVIPTDTARSIWHALGRCPSRASKCPCFPHGINNCRSRPMRFLAAIFGGRAGCAASI